MKYLNPHMVVIVTEKQQKWFNSEVTSKESESNTEANGNSDTQSVDELYVNVIDSVSAQVPLSSLNLVSFTSN